MKTNPDNPVDNFDKCIDPVMTAEAAQEFVQHLNNAQASLFTTTREATMKKLKAALSHHEYQHIKAYGDAHNLSLNNTAALRELLPKLKEYIERTPRLKLTIAYNPSQAFTEEIVDWLAAHAPVPLILEIAIDPTIIGGSIIETEGRLHDASVKRKIDEYLADKQRARIDSIRRPA